MKLNLFEANEIKNLRALHDHVIVTDMGFDERITTGGTVLRKDDGKSQGIRPRWGQVYAIGPDQTDIAVGQWICVAHGRWTRGVVIRDHEGEKTIRRIDHDDILLVSDDKPAADDTMSTAVIVDSKAN